VVHPSDKIQSRIRIPRIQKLITNVTHTAIPPKKEFAALAPGRCVCPWWVLAHDWNRNVGSAGSRTGFYTSWPSHFSDRISMGQKVALDSSSMDARSFSEDQIKGAI
jgi:hypothetical protein